MSRSAIWIALAVALFITSLGAAAYVWHRAENAPVPVDTRFMLGHAASTAEQRERASLALSLLETDTAGPLQRYRKIESAHTLRVRSDLCVPSVHGTIAPFPDEIAALETELWARLARDLSTEVIRTLTADGFALDAFPFGRASFDFYLSGANSREAQALNVTGPVADRWLHGALAFDAALAHVIDG